MQRKWPVSLQLSKKKTDSIKRLICQSILGPILFNIFMSDIFFLLGSDLHNFADDNNTVTAAAETIQDLINSLDVKTCTAFEGMKDNDMIATRKN